MRRPAHPADVCLSEPRAILDDPREFGFVLGRTELEHHYLGASVVLAGSASAAGSGSGRQGSHRAGYPGRGGGLWLRMILPAGLVTWLVPSG